VGPWVCLPLNSSVLIVGTVGYVLPTLDRFVMGSHYGEMREIFHCHKVWRFCFERHGKKIHDELVVDSRLGQYTSLVPPVWITMLNHLFCF